jgi:adenine phosphoribosyltransferase
MDNPVALPPSKSVERIKAGIRDIPDFPKPGIIFKDITTVLRQPDLLQEVVDHFYERVQGKNIQYVAGIESRGFILGTPLAYKLGAGFIPIRKRGKLPGLVERHEYDLEYGSDCIEIHADAIEAGANVVLIDDLLATGGTAAAAATLLGKLNANIVEIQFMIELGFLDGKQKLPTNTSIYSMIQY